MGLFVLFTICKKSDNKLDVAKDEEDKPPKEPKFEEITTHSWNQIEMVHY